MAGFAQRTGGGGGFRKVKRLPDNPKDGDAYYLDRDQHTVYVESDFNLDFRPGSVTETGAFSLFGFATAAAVATTPGVLAAAGTLEGAGAGIFYLVNRGGFAQLAITPAARAEFGDAITLGLITYAGADIGDSRTLSLEGINAAYIIYTGNNLLPLNFRWGGDGAALVVRLQGSSGKWLLPGGTFARLGDVNPDGELEYRKGFYVVQDGRYVLLSLDVVDRLPANPLDGLINFVPEHYLGAPSTIEVVGGAIGGTVGYTIASVADDIVVGAPAQAVGSLEGAGDDGATIAAFWYSQGRGAVYVLAQEDLTLAAFHAPGGRYALTEIDVGDAHAIRVAGYRWWGFAYDRNSINGGTIFGVSDATAPRIAAAFAAGIGINLEDSDGNYLNAEGAWVDPDTLRPDVLAGYYFSLDGEWHRQEIITSDGNVTAAVNLWQNGSDEEGLEIASTVEGAGADWGFVADTRDVLVEPYIDFYTGAAETDDRPGFRISFDGNVYRGERGNGIRLSASTTAVPAAPNVAITGPRYEQAANRHAIYILTKAGVALTLNDVIAALNAVAGVTATLINGATGAEAYDISRTYAQEYGTQEAVGGAVVSHSGTHEPLTPVVDETAKTFTVPYDVHIDDLNAILAAINGIDGFEAILTHGATGTNAPEAAGFTRSFEGRRGARGADTGEDAIARQLARAAQNTADGKLGRVVFRTAASAAAFQQNAREADDSGNVYFLYISSDYQVDGFPYETGETYVWDQSVPGFVKVAAAIDHDDIVRLISFDVADVASAAELATFLRTDNTRSGNLIRITADFSSGGVDYKNLDLWAFDTTDGVLKRLYRQPADATVPAEMPFLHAVLAPAVPAGAGLNVDEAVPTNWGAVRFNRGDESSDDWEDHFTLAAVGDDEVEADFDGRVQVFVEIDCDGIGGSGSNYRSNLEIRARRTRGANTAIYPFGRTYIRGQTYSGSIVVSGSTWIQVEDGDHIDIQIRRASNNANATLHTGRFGFMRLRGAGPANAGSGLSQSPGGDPSLGAQVHPIFDQAGLDSAASLAAAGGVHFAYMILDVGLWQAGYTLVWDSTTSGWLAIGRTNFNQVVDYTEIASQAALDALALDGVQLVRITTAFGAWAVDDILTYITTLTSWRKIGSVAAIPSSSPTPSSPPSTGYANIHVEQWVTAFGAFQDSALGAGGEPPDAPFGMSRTLGVFLGSGTGGPWHLSPNLAQNSVGVPVWETRARAAPLNDGSGLYDISATQVKRRLTEAGAILYALDDIGTGAAEEPPANWTHFSIRRPDGRRGPWIAKVQPPQSSRMLFAIANSFRVARRYDLPSEIGTFRLSEYRYLEGRIINYTTGYAAATYRGGGAFLPTALADTVPPAGADQWSAQYGLDRVYRLALGGPHRVASFSRGGSALSAGAFSGLGGLIDITFENPAPSVGTDPSGIVQRIICHANGHPLDDGARFELWGIP